MKRLLALTLLLIPCGAALAEDAVLTANTVLRTSDSLVILKAGTVVHILAHNDKTLSVKAGGKTGLIPVGSVELYSDADMMTAPSKPAPAPAAKTAPTTVKTAATPTPAPASAAPATPRPAQTMYGKAVEKAAAAASSHEKAMVSPTDEVLDGK